jgi:hypothetical protein
MGYGVVPVQAVVGICGRVVGLGGCGRGSGKSSVHTTVVLRVGKGHGGGAVALRIVLLLLLLRWIAVSTVVTTERRRGRPLAHRRRTGSSDEQLVVVALRITVAAGGRVSIACSSSIRLVSIIGACWPATVLVLILAGRTAVARVSIVGVGYAWIVVVLPVSVVRHGADCARGLLRGRGGW